MICGIAPTSATIKLTHPSISAGRLFNKAVTILVIISGRLSIIGCIIDEKLLASVVIIDTNASINIGINVGNAEHIDCKSSGNAVTIPSKILCIPEINCGSVSIINCISCGIAPTIAFTRATAPLTTDGNSVDSISGIFSIILGANCVIRLATPSRILLTLGIRFSPAVLTLFTNSSINVPKSALSEVIPVTRLAQLDLTIDKEPDIVLLASFAVVPVMSNSVCIT